MQPANHFTPKHKERAPGLYRQMGVRAPFVWLAVWMIRIGQRAGFISREFLNPPPPAPKSLALYSNRKNRRAMISCRRRGYRFARKYKRQPDWKYFCPRAFKWAFYINRMDKTITPAQFNERYIRDNNMSRAEIYGLSAAHEITGFVPGLREALSSLFANIIGLIGGSSLSLAAPTDPAPP